MSEIKKYTDEYKLSVIGALEQLQQHEQKLSSARKNSTAKLAAAYLEVLLGNIQNNAGQIFVSIAGRQFMGFISYYFVSEETIFETANFNHYALISDICVLAEFRKQGVAITLFDAVFEHLSSIKYVGRVRLTSLANNKTASSAYLKYGFAPYEITYEKFSGASS